MIINLPLAKDASTKDAHFELYLDDPSEWTDEQFNKAAESLADFLKENCPCFFMASLRLALQHKQKDIKLFREVIK